MECRLHGLKRLARIVLIDNIFITISVIIILDQLALFIL